MTVYELAERLNGAVDMFQFHEYGHYSNRVFRPENIVSEQEDEWIWKHIETIHFEVRNNKCDVHIAYFTDTKRNDEVISDFDLKNMFWKELEQTK